jgi:hypothetical protein
MRAVLFTKMFRGQSLDQTRTDLRFIRRQMTLRQTPTQA